METITDNSGCKSFDFSPGQKVFYWDREELLTILIPGRIGCQNMYLVADKQGNEFSVYEDELSI